MKRFLVLCLCLVFVFSLFSANMAFATSCGDEGSEHKGSAPKGSDVKEKLAPPAEEGVDKGEAAEAEEVAPPEEGAEEEGAEEEGGEK